MRSSTTVFSPWLHGKKKWRSLVTWTFYPGPFVHSPCEIHQTARQPANHRVGRYNRRRSQIPAGCRLRSIRRGFQKQWTSCPSPPAAAQRWRGFRLILGISFQRLRMPPHLFYFHRLRPMYNLAFLFAHQCLDLDVVATGEQLLKHPPHLLPIPSVRCL